MSGKLGKWFTGLSGFSVVLGACGHSGSGTQSCRYENWQGTCQLRSVQRVKTIERFPRTFVVLEALYEPQGTGAPPTVSHQTTAQALHEAQLRDYFAANPRVQCSVQEAAGASCDHPAIHLALPEFTPTENGVAQAGPTGCEQIETSETARQTATQKQITEEFKFEQHSAVPGAGAQATIDRIARTILDDSAIQCVAISGQIAFGEKLDLGEERAEAIQSMLVAKGIDRTRLTVMRNLVPAYTSTPPQERVALPQHRTVRLAVVVYRN